MVFQEVFGLGFGSLGGLMLFNAVRTFRASDRRHAYEPVDARVLDSRLDTDSGTPGEPTTTRYVPRIRYEYTVGGETYVNDNVYPGSTRPGYADEQRERDVVEKYPEGETVEAYYDPADPSRSFLERESQSRQALGLGVLGAALLLSGLALVLFRPL